MKKQRFPTLTLHFNLRSPGREEKPTPIYAVVRHEGRQHKFATGVKVAPRHWSRRWEVCLRSPMLSPLANENAAAANDVLRRVRSGVARCAEHLRETGGRLSREERRAVVLGHAAPDAAARAASKASDLLRRALREYYATRPDSMRPNETRLKAFLRFLDEEKVEDTVAVVCSQETLDAFQRRLLAAQKSTVYVNACVELVARLVNQDPRLRTGEPLAAKKVKAGVKRDDGKKRALTAGELRALRDVALENELENEVRDLFLCQCHTGQRISDMPKLLEKNAKSTQIEQQIFIQIVTQKENIRADVLIDEEAKKLIDKYRAQGGFRKLKPGTWSSVSLATTVGRVLKEVARKAGLVAEEAWVESVGGREVRKTAPLWSVISSHWARHTFVTNKLLEGVAPDDLCALTGHADDAMIKAVYGHLSLRDKAGRAVKQMRAHRAENSGSGANAPDGRDGH